MGLLEVIGLLETIALLKAVVIHFEKEMYKMYMRLIALIGLLLASASASADSKQDWIDFSDVGSAGLVVSALAVPTYNSDWEGLKQASYSMLAATGGARLGKALVSKTRPDNSDDESFPSNHTSTSFGAALCSLAGWIFTTPNDKQYTIIPWGDTKNVGVQVSMNW